jgi:hypothetical protein
MKKMNFNEFSVSLVVLNVAIHQIMDPVVELNVLSLMQIDALR